MVNLYAFYVLEIALRIAVLEVIGVTVSDDVKNYVMDEHLDWIKLEKHLDEDCVLPMNVFRQMMEKLQNQDQKCLVVRHNLLLPTLLLTARNNLLHLALFCQDDIPNTHFTNHRNPLQTRDFGANQGETKL